METKFVSQHPFRQTAGTASKNASNLYKFAADFHNKCQKNAAATLYCLYKKPILVTLTWTLNRLHDSIWNIPSERWLHLLCSSKNWRRFKEKWWGWRPFHLTRPLVGTSFTEMFAANDWKAFQSCWANSSGQTLLLLYLFIASSNTRKKTTYQVDSSSLWADRPQIWLLNSVGLGPPWPHIMGKQSFAVYLHIQHIVDWIKSLEFSPF
jgi:hypothetical protein